MTWADYSATAADAAAVEAAMPQAIADTEMSQGESATFIKEYGAAVLDGHGTVEGPGGVGGPAGL